MKKTANEHWSQYTVTLKGFQCFTVAYSIAGKFGEEFNLKNWLHQTQIANLKFANFLTQSSYTHIQTMQYESANYFRQILVLTTVTSNSPNFLPTKFSCYTVLINVRHDLLCPNHMLKSKWLLVEITVTFLVVVVLVAIVEENQFLWL